MKKFFMLCFMACLALGVQAQLLWKISGNGLPQASYILGTHHLAPLSIVDSIPGLAAVQQEVGQVYGEVPMEEMMKPEKMAEMQQAMALPGDTTLQMLYTAEEYATVSATLQQLLGVDPAMLSKLKPAAVNATLAIVLSMQALPGFNPQQQLDTWFQQEAKKMGKAVGGLETIDSQINVLYNSQSLQRQAELLLCAVTHMDFSKEQIREMSEAYMQQDLDRLLEVMLEETETSCDSRPEEMDVLIYNRNANWVKIMPGIMQDKATLFVVGGGHLPGEQGVLHLLKAQGFEVEAVAE